MLDFLLTTGVGTWATRVLSDARIKKLSEATRSKATVWLEVNSDKTHFASEPTQQMLMFQSNQNYF